MSSAKEIAAKLGISPSAVSIAMNNRPGISEETRTLILETAKEMGYNHKPRKSNAGGDIHLVIITQGLQAGFDCNSFIDRHVEGISMQSRAMGYNLKIVYVTMEDIEGKKLEDITDENCRGIILMASVCEGIPKIFQNSEKIPVVVLDKPADYCGLDCVTASNNSGIMKSLDYLYSNGHRVLAYVGGSSDNSNSEERRNSYWHSIRRFPELAGCENNIYTVKYSDMDGTAPKIVDEMIASGNMPTGIICATDFTALSVIKALNARGFRIPDDVSVIGYDNVPVGQVCIPSLTTVDVPKKRMGAIAVIRLDDIINGVAQESVRIEVLTDLLVRESTGPVKKK